MTTTATKHTPGPWEADVTDWPLLITRAGDHLSGHCVAQIPEADRFWPDDETSRANAALIAEAPAMCILIETHLSRAACYCDGDPKFECPPCQARAILARLGSK